MKAGFRDSGSGGVIQNGSMEDQSSIRNLGPFHWRISLIQEGRWSSGQTTGWAKSLGTGAMHCTMSLEDLGSIQDYRSLPLDDAPGMGGNTDFRMGDRLA